MFDKRSSHTELLDDPSTSPQDLHASLRFMAVINRYFGGARVITDYFEKQPLSDEFSVLDLGSGGGDIPHALAKWAKKKGKRIRITALDLNPHCLEFARNHYASPEIHYVRHSAFEINKLDKHDYVISSMFFHHLNDEEIMRLLSLIQSHVRCGFIINDLRRGLWPYLAATITGAVSGKYIVYHDARRSVERAFKTKDFRRYATEAGLKNFIVQRNPWFRLSLRGEAP